MTTTTTGTGGNEGIVTQVKKRYAEIAVTGSSCCGPAPTQAAGCCARETTAEGISQELGYSVSDLAGVPKEADLGLGCGVPLGHLKLEAGETVVDLGSGPGLDALLAAQQVGSTGRVIGVDMTPEMLERARGTAAKVGATNVDFRQGRLEQLPVETASVDAVTSNCVINLVPDKAAVFGEIARVLKPGGRVVVSDIVLDRPLPEAVAKDVFAWCGCVAGASDRKQYLALVEAAGLGEVEVLKDVDYLASLVKVAPEEADAMLAGWGVTRDDLAGTVHSITWRAVRR
ncbi:MAG: arsenite methyltransferase [Burkholderiales bacterium]|jgi:SAM-dependent methyltransferase